MEIKLLDENLDTIGYPIDDYSSLTYTDKWEESGSFTAVMSNDHYANVAAASYVYFDSRTYEIETLNSEDVLTISGQDLSAMLDRIVIYDVERLQGRLELMTRYLVAKYAMSGSQLIPKLVLETDNDFKRAMDVTTERGSLGTFLRTALNQRDFSFSLDYDIALDKIVFHLLRSTDRSQDQETNTTVMFSSDSGNIEKITYKRTSKDYRNFAYVCDEDETAPQTVEVDLSNGEPIRAMYVSGKRAGADDSAAPNLMVSVGNTGYIATSTDGINWTQRTSGTTSNLWSIFYVNGLFAAGGDGGIVVVSSDAINWSVKNTGSSDLIEGCEYFDGMYLAFDMNGVIYASYDTDTWTVAFDGMGVGRIVNAIKTTNGILAFGHGTGGIEKLFSQDGSSWTRTHIPYSDSGMGCAVYKTVSYAEKIVCTGYTISTPYIPLVFVSDDFGETWAYYLLSSFSGMRFFDATYGSGVVVAVGCPDASQPGIIAYSTDGVDWTDATPAGSTDWYSIVFDGTKFCALGYSTRNVAISTDGISWTVHARSPATGYISSATYGTSSHSGNLRQIGLDALQATRTADIIDGEILPDVEPIYGTDYVVGDIADIKDAQRGILASKRIVEVQHIREPNQIVTIPKFGVNFLNLRQYISKEIKTNG